jgi:hypothetical protein
MEVIVTRCERWIGVGGSPQAHATRRHSDGTRVYARVNRQRNAANTVDTRRVPQRPLTLPLPPVSHEEPNAKVHEATEDEGVHASVVQHLVHGQANHVP